MIVPFGGGCDPASRCPAVFPLLLLLVELHLQFDSEIKKSV